MIRKIRMFYILIGKKSIAKTSYKNHKENLSKARYFSKCNVAKIIVL